MPSPGPWRLYSPWPPEGPNALLIAKEQVAELFEPQGFDRGDCHVRLPNDMTVALVLLPGREPWKRDQFILKGLHRREKARSFRLFYSRGPRESRV